MFYQPLRSQLWAGTRLAHELPGMRGFGVGCAPGSCNVVRHGCGVTRFGLCPCMDRQGISSTQYEARVFYSSHLERPMRVGVCQPKMPGRKTSWCVLGRRHPQLGQVLTKSYPTLRPGPESAFPSCCQPALCPQARHSPASWWTGRWSASSSILLSTPSRVWSSLTGLGAACGARSVALTGSSRWRAAGATAAPATASGETLAP